MAQASSYYHGNEPGHIRASVADGERMGKIIGRSRRILLVSGPRIDGKDSSPMTEVIRTLPASTMVASPRTRGFMAQQDGVEPDAYMNVLEVMDRVRDPYWKGFDGGGRYDLVILLAMDYYYASQMFSLMKHFGYGVKSMSLDSRYQPNASYSFSNLSPEAWRGELAKLTGMFGGDS